MRTVTPSNAPAGALGCWGSRLAVDPRLSVKVIHRLFDVVFDLSAMRSAVAVAQCASVRISESILTVQLIAQRTAMFAS
jgi:hypothetical protein